jgi:hypothetical protein
MDFVDFKDYDGDAGELPSDWSHRFDVSNWMFGAKTDADAALVKEM